MAEVSGGWQVADGVTIRRVRGTPWDRTVPENERVRRIVVAIFAAGCLAGAIALLVFAVRTFWRTSGWSETTGTVTERHRDGDDDWDSTIRFEDSDGFHYTFRSESGASVNSRVKVMYPPRDPDRAQTAADINEDRLLGFLFGAIAAAAGGWAALWSVGRLGDQRGWFQPESWPPRTPTSDLTPPSRLGSPKKREKWARKQESWASQQAESVGQELERVPPDRLPPRSISTWKSGRCRVCGKGVPTTVEAWRERYTTVRCPSCLWWRQVAAK